MKTARPAPLHVFVTAPGFEEALAKEMKLPRGVGGRWPSVLSTPEGFGAPADPVFALQQLPQAQLVRGESVRGLAQAAFEMVEAAVDAAASFTLAVFTADPEGAYRTISGRAALLETTLLALLEGRRRRAFRRFIRWDEAAAGWGTMTVVQVALVGRGAALVSAVRPRALPTGGFDVAPWPGGRAPVTEDRRAPSRAYRKLQEGLAWLGRAPLTGETCVDLGGAPGGWAWTVLERGARVIAVDRTPLAPSLLGHPRLTMAVGNAFTYEPASPVVWLLCDVICEPARTIELVERWMKNSWCRNVVATIKFKGAPPYDLLAAVHQQLSPARWPWVRIKHLHHHHNEAVILASCVRDGDDAQAPPPLRRR